MKQRGLSRLEDLAQEMVEGTFGRLFGGYLEPLYVASQLVKVIEDNEHMGQMNLNYWVALNPEDLRFLTSENPRLADRLAAAAQELGRKANLAGEERPVVQLTADDKLKRRRIRITTQSKDIEHETGQLTLTFRQSDKSEDHLRLLNELDAFLIIQGRRHIPLKHVTISIGRRAENDIVIDLPSVSRRHAQIRWRYGHFILYDISSRGITLVNGHPVHEHVLRPGDVIALSDALLVYGEGNEEFTPKRHNELTDDETLARASRNP